MHPLSLPPYSPELNPAEQVFRHIHMHLSNTLFTTLDELQNALINELQQFWERPTVLLQLTGYPWWVQAIEVTYQPPHERVLGGSERLGGRDPGGTNRRE
jgi:hypothetical protein